MGVDDGYTPEVVAKDQSLSDAIDGVASTAREADKLGLDASATLLDLVHDRLRRAYDHARKNNFKDE